MEISVFKDLFKSQDVPFHVPLAKVIERIRRGASKDILDKIRSGDKSLKNKLPCILFAGIFNERNSKSLKKHSGLMVVDFDKYPDQQTMAGHLEFLKQNQHFVLLFISPSGNGIKGVVRVSDDLTKDTHPLIFKAFQKEFDFEYFDISNSNVDRVCFESYDPNIYVNLEAVIFNPEIKDEGFMVQDKVPMVPITDQDIIIKKILEWNWKRDFIQGERNTYIFDLAGAFCEYGITLENAIGYILNNVIHSGFTEAEATTAIKSAYKKRSFESKYFEDYTKINRIKTDLKNGKKEVLTKHNIDEDIYNQIKEVTDIEDFWYFEKDKSGKDKIKIDAFKYKLFLERNGFKKYFPNETQKPTWVKIESNKVSETSIEKIKDFVLDYLLKNGEHNVWGFCANYMTLFSENYLLMLNTIDLMLLKDLKDKSFIAFKNGILEVTKSTAKLIDYIDVNGYVWESQIIQRDFVNSENIENDYKVFVNNISNSNPMPIECTIGYLLSTYKNKMNNKAIILNDEVISENPEGGTGKGLLVQGLRQIRRVSILDGKTFDDKKSFPYQTVNPETQILVFDDVKKNFDFESKFSIVTEGMTLERKNKDAVKIKVEDSPKMMISTNYAIKGEGNSHDRRRHEIEISQYYGRKLTPYDEFNKQLFDDWDLAEFERFDNYMVLCLQLYLQNGLIKQDAKNIKLRKFIAESSMEFYEWVRDTENVSLNIRHDKVTYFNNFIDEYQDFKKWLTRKKFNIWIQKYCAFADLEYNDGNSNGMKWFTIGKEVDDDPIPF